MSSKRAANQELNHENWNDEEESEEVGMFKKASESELQQRVRKVASTDSAPNSSSLAKIPNQSSPTAQSPEALQNLGSQQNYNVAQSLSGSQPEYQQNYYSNQGYTVNQQGQYIHDPFSQQNYSCFTPTINSTNSYKASDVSQSAQTTQSVNYSQTQEATPTNNGFITHHATAMDSPLRQPHSIPTYSAAVNAIATSSNEMHMTHSQQQVVSHSENRESTQTLTPVNQVVTPVVSQQLAPVIQPPAPVVAVAVAKSSNIDLLSGIDFSMTTTIDSIPTLMPVSAVKPLEVSPKKVLAPEPPAPAPVKLNDDLAELDSSSLSMKTVEPPKTDVPEYSEISSGPSKSPLTADAK